MMDGDNDNSDEDEVRQKKPTEKRKTKKHMKRAAKEMNKGDVRKNKDYEHFLQDIEDDPEFRANMNLYKDDDVIGQLEAQISNMKLDDKPEEPSKLKKDMEAGKAGDRVIKAGVRKTAIGKAKEFQMEKERKKAELLLKANLRDKEEGSASDWESAEEDAPAIKLEELLNNMKITDDNEKE